MILPENWGVLNTPELQIYLGPVTNYHPVVRRHILSLLATVALRRPQDPNSHIIAHTKLGSAMPE